MVRKNKKPDAEPKVTDEEIVKNRQAEDEELKNYRKELGRISTFDIAEEIVQEERVRQQAEDVKEAEE